MEWRGNVRQLENTARWLTVMASGREIHCEDLPPELHRQHERRGCAMVIGRPCCGHSVRSNLAAGKVALLDQTTPEFETVMIETALEHTGGRKQDAARLLGWGRNTLTRKIKELGLEDEHREAG